MGTTLQDVGVIDRAVVAKGNGGFAAENYVARVLWRGASEPLSRDVRISAEQQDVFLLELFSDPTQWWDIRRRQQTSGQPEMEETIFKSSSPQAPAWLKLRVSTCGAGSRPPEILFISRRGQRNVAICGKVRGNKSLSEDVDILNLLVQRGCHVPKKLFYYVLKKCIADNNLVMGRRVHALTVASGYEGDEFLATQLIGLYASQGKLQEAMCVFATVSMPNAFNLASIIFACARLGEAELAIRLYKEMRESALQPDNRVYVAVVKACATAGDLATGKEVHAHILASPRKQDVFLQTALITMYAKCGCVVEARNLFDSISDRNIVTCTAMIAGYVQQGKAQEALLLYNSMEQKGLSSPDSVTFVCLLQACAMVGSEALQQGQQLAAHIKERGLQCDPVLGGSLVHMYAKCGSLNDARRVFESLAEKNVATWTTMIAGYVQNGMGQKAFCLYHRMQQEGLHPKCSAAFVCLLQACASLGEKALHEGKKLHVQIREHSLQVDVVLGCSLVNMYAKCGSLADARSVFDSLTAKNPVTWNAMMSGYVHHGRGQEALVLYDVMQKECLCPPTSATYVCLLQACACVGVEALHEGKQLHAQIAKQGLEDDVVIGGSLITMYMKCGSVGDASSMFDRLRTKNVVTWTAMIAGYAQQGMGQEALLTYHNMLDEGLCVPDSVTLVCLIQACASLGVAGLVQGKQLHARIVEQGLHDDLVLGCSLVNMYSKCNSIEDARRLFDRLPGKTIVTWTAMMTGYAQHKMGQEALELYSNIEEQRLFPLDPAIYVCLLQACVSVGVGALAQGKRLHEQIKEQGLQVNSVVACSLVNMYVKCGSVVDAITLFHTLSVRNVETWTAMITGYVELGMGEEALKLYSRMQLEGIWPPSSVTFVILLQACANLGVGALYQGKLLHGQIEELGLQCEVVLGGSLVNMYVKCGSLVDARRVFDNLLVRNVLTWTAMIAGYAQQGMGHEALRLYNSMQQEGLSLPDAVTFVFLLHACASVGLDALDKGKQLHAQIDEQGFHDHGVLSGSVVSMYWKCGSLAEARNVFDGLPKKTVAVWAAMIAGYAQHGMDHEVLGLYSGMRQEGLSPEDPVTFVHILHACASVTCVPIGKQVHAEIDQRGLQADVYVGAALVNMYAKCGSMAESQQVFDSLPKKTVESWGALIGGYTRRGESEFVFALLERMQFEGVKPNGITFLSVLTVCSHVGLVDKGSKFFDEMRTTHGISPTIEHYTCMIDLLGRAGHLVEAVQMARTMPCEPNHVVWHTILGACRKWNNVEVGELAFAFAVRLDEKDSAAYVLMSNIYERAEMWEEATDMRARRKKFAAWKKPGQCWWTDVSGVAHRFVVGEDRHASVM